MKDCRGCDRQLPASSFYQYKTGPKAGQCVHFCIPCAKLKAKERARLLKEKVLDIAGKHQCEICDYDKYVGALEFHHCNPEEKDFQINRAAMKDKQKLLDELNKCVLLCSNCHREVHAGLRDTEMNALTSPKPTKSKPKNNG